jgi:glyoxylase-like metal-dependent hydrolase (beta-lactamase superfamily II)
VLAGVLPRAFVVVHPRGARHLADPARLREGVKAVYGEEVFGRVFEPVLPVPRERIIEGADGLELRTGGKILKIIDAPGHAYHHFIVHAPTDSAVFTGDAAGLTFSAFLELGLEFSMPTTSPTQFNPQKMKATMARIAALDPKHLLLTHYGAARDPQALLSRNIGLIDTYMRLWEESLQSGAPADWKRVEEALRSFHLDELEALGVPRDHPAHRTVFLDYEINAKGIVHHLMESRDVTSRIR